MALDSGNRLVAYGSALGQSAVEMVACGTDRFLFLPGVPALPAPVIDEIHRIGAIADQVPRTDFSIGSMTQPDPSGILEHGRSKKFLNVSLFAIDVSWFAGRVSRTCPHSLPGTIEAQACTFLSRILGIGGRCGIVDDGRILCASYGHSTGDPELIAAQAAKAMARALKLPGSSGIATGPFLSALLADPDAELSIRSFIDGLRDS